MTNNHLMFSMAYSRLPVANSVIAQSWCNLKAMSADHRLFSLLDDHDVFPYDPSLRIPPLQNPLPLSSSSRPSPLEPNARINEASHGTATKLISRREALAEAKSIGESEASNTKALPKVVLT